MTTTIVVRQGQFRAALPAITLAIIALLSLVFPLITPAFALLGGTVSLPTARRTASTWAWVAFAVCVLVLALSLVIDLGLLAASSGEIGPPTVSAVPQ